jgi:hypothetical protein
MECQLDSSGSKFRHSDGTTVPARAMNFVPVSEIATQKLFQNLKFAATHYYILYFIDLANVVLLFCGQVADIRPTQTIVRPHKFRDDKLGSPPENNYS